MLPTPKELKKMGAKELYRDPGVGSYHSETIIYYDKTHIVLHHASTDLETGNYDDMTNVHTVEEWRRGIEDLVSKGEATLETADGGETELTPYSITLYTMRGTFDMDISDVARRFRI